MRVYLRSILYLGKDGTPTSGTEGGLVTGRSVDRVQDFDTIISPNDAPEPLSAAATIDNVDTLLLLPEGEVSVYFGNNNLDGVTVGPGGVLFLTGGQIAVNPPLQGGVAIRNAGSDPVRIRGLVGGTLQELE